MLSHLFMWQLISGYILQGMSHYRHSTVSVDIILYTLCSDCPTSVQGSWLALTLSGWSPVTSVVSDMFQTLHSDNIPVLMWSPLHFLTPSTLFS